MLQKSVIRRTKASSDAPVLPLDLFTVECIHEWDEVNRERRMISVDTANAMRSGQHPRRFFPDCDAITTPMVQCRWRGDQRGIERADRGMCEEQFGERVICVSDTSVSKNDPDCPTECVAKQVAVEFRLPDELNVVPLHDLVAWVETTDGKLSVEVLGSLCSVDWERGIATYNAGPTGDYRYI